MSEKRITPADDNGAKVGMHVRIDRALHRRLKIEAAMWGTTLANLVEVILRTDLNRPKSQRESLSRLEEVG